MTYFNNEAKKHASASYIGPGPVIGIPEITTIVPINTLHSFLVRA